MKRTSKLLQLVAENVAIDNTIIVTTANLGQAYLLANFLCSAKRSKLDIRNRLIIAANPKAHQIARGLELLPIMTISYVKVIIYYI